MLTFDGTVVANFGAAAAVQAPDGTLRRAVPLKRLDLVVAGDRVHCEGNTGHELRITARHPRESVLERPDHRGQLKPLAANLSQLLIVAATQPMLDTRLIDQFCVIAEHIGVRAIIVINKLDLLADELRPQLVPIIDAYAAIGYTSVMTSATVAGGLDPLRDSMRHECSVLVGQSGVGKSSIVQALLPDLNIRIGAISAATGIGSHTTTVSCRYELPGGGVLIDSPGVRQFPVEHLPEWQIAQGYREITEVSRRCRFGDCRHQSEPDCAVRQAVSAGSIARFRLENFHSLL